MCIALPLPRRIGEKQAFAGSLVSMLAAMQKESSFVAAHKEKLEQFITTRKIAMGLAFRMRTYYNYALIHIADNENFPLIMGLSYSLRCVMQLGTPVLTERRAFWQSLIAQILSFGQVCFISRISTVRLDALGAGVSVCCTFFETSCHVCQSCVEDRMRLPSSW